MHMMRYLRAIGATLLLAAGLALTFGPAAGATSDEVCPGLDSGKIDTSGDPQSVTVDAPAGSLISGYCVKGGSEGPIFVTVDPPASSVTIDYPGVNGGGQQPAVSHYSLSYVPVTTTVPTTVPDDDPPPTTQTPPTSSIPDEPTGSIDVDKTVHGDPDCEDDEPCFVIDIDCEDLDFRQVYDRTGHLIEGDSTYHDIPPGTVCIVTETVTGGADTVTYDPANANTTGVVITAEDPENGRDQRVHVMVTNDFEPPPTTVPTTVPDTTVPPTTEPPPPTTEVPPPTTVPPPPTTEVPPPTTVPTCEDDPSQPGCSDRDDVLPRTGSNDTHRRVAGAFALIASGIAFLAGKKRLTA
jgi:hypothetical protein